MNIMHFRSTATKYAAVLLYGLFAYAGLAVPACMPRQHTEYQAFRSLIPAGAVPDEDKRIALLLYNPQGCMPCNYILYNLFGNPRYTALFGKNSFVVFPSVRPSELADFDHLFKTYGQVNVQYINDKKLFDLLRKKDKEKLGDKPRWLGLDETSKKCVCFDLKEQYLADSISHYFKE